MKISQTSGSFIVLGMAPGKVEDAKGVPFVGPAGTLLRNELRRTGIDPKSAYYMNVVSCAPPDNKVTATHIDACRQNLKDQLEIADAEWVLVCGNVAIETMIPHATPHTRERVVNIHGKRLWCVYHPSYILRANDRSVYHHWQHSLTIFKLLLEQSGISDFLHADFCIYCGVQSDFPACKNCMKLWKIDSKWRYSPPPQLKLGI